MSIFELDKDTLEKIKRFVKAHWKVDMNADQVIEEVQKRFGYRLSKRELRYLYEDRVKTEVELPLEVVRILTRRYGSVSRGIKELTKGIRAIRFRDRQFQKVYDELAGREVTWQQLEERLGERTPEFLRELHRRYLLERRGNKFFIRLRPEYDILSFFQ